ncbi:MAG: hypothetical protein E3J47_05770 [Candidatus Stahlbacteria bacterium]|nr:MAG: hypothetical protein E3J47_05770 [Candidatus Stahlbacteria bacterium]
MSQSKIRFVAVELLKKGGTNTTSVEYGLFKGMKIRSNGATENPEIVSYVLIEKERSENNIHALNLDNFNIMSISSRCDNTKELALFKSHEADQKKAGNLLLDFLDRLTKDKRMVKNDPEIIDVYNYTDLPGGIKKVKPANCFHNNAYQYSSGTSEWEKKKETREKEEKRQEELRKIPTVFKRGDDIPGVKALNLMKKKVLMIAAGEYESDVVPSKKQEEEKTKEKRIGYVAG